MIFRLPPAGDPSGLGTCRAASSSSWKTRGGVGLAELQQVADEMLRDGNAQIRPAPP